MRMAVIGPSEMSGERRGPEGVGPRGCGGPQGSGVQKGPKERGPFWTPERVGVKRAQEQTEGPGSPGRGFVRDQGV